MYICSWGKLPGEIWGLEKGPYVGSVIMVNHGSESDSESDDTEKTVCNVEDKAAVRPMKQMSLVQQMLFQHTAAASADRATVPKNNWKARNSTFNNYYARPYFPQIIIIMSPIFCHPSYTFCPSTLVINILTWIITFNVFACVYYMEYLFIILPACQIINSLIWLTISRSKCVYNMRVSVCCRNGDHCMLCVYELYCGGRERDIFPLPPSYKCSSSTPLLLVPTEPLSPRTTGKQGTPPSTSPSRLESGLPPETQNCIVILCQLLCTPLFPPNYYNYVPYFLSSQLYFLSEHLGY
eukprot:sb/3467504/